MATEEDPQATVSRRDVLLRWTGKVIERVGPPVLVGLLWRILDRRNQMLREKMTALFDPAGESDQVAIVPGLQNPHDPKDREFSGSGVAVSKAFEERFAREGHVYVARKYLQVRKDDGEVLIASPYSNAVARQYFYDMKHPYAPLYAIKDPYGTWSTHLQWSFWTPRTAEEKTFYHDGRRRRSVVHVISERDNAFRYQPSYRRDPAHGVDVQDDDYLLLTVLPKSNRGGHRIINFAGLHRPGTLASGMLLAQPDSRILDKIIAETGGSPWYQALFYINVEQSADKTPGPASLTLVGARALDLVFAR